jgi:hypothetical protein
MAKNLHPAFLLFLKLLLLLQFVLLKLRSMCVKKIKILELLQTAVNLCKNPFGIKQHHAGGSHGLLSA